MDVNGSRSGGPTIARAEWIERALEPLRRRLSAEQLERLTSAFALVVGGRR